MTEPCKYEKDIGYIKATMEGLDKRINGSYDAIVQHVKDGHRWRGAVVSIGAMFIVQLVSFAFGYGIMHKAVENNAYAIEEIKQNDQDVKAIRSILEKMQK